MCFIPAQGKRPGIIAPKITQAESLLHLFRAATSFIQKLPVSPLGAHNGKRRVEKCLQTFAKPGLISKDLSFQMLPVSESRVNFAQSWSSALLVRLLFVDSLQGMLVQDVLINAVNLIGIKIVEAGVKVERHDGRFLIDQNGFCLTE